MFAVLPGVRNRFWFTICSWVGRTQFLKFPCGLPLHESFYFSDDGLTWLSTSTAKCISFSYVLENCGGRESVGTWAQRLGLRVSIPILAINVNSDLKMPGYFLSHNVRHLYKWPEVPWQERPRVLSWYILELVYNNSVPSPRTPATSLVNDFWIWKFVLVWEMNKELCFPLC